MHPYLILLLILGALARLADHDEQHPEAPHKDPRLVQQPGSAVQITVVASAGGYAY